VVSAKEGAATIREAAPKRARTRCFTVSSRRYDEHMLF
jgi:hypothetical protein